MAIEGFRTDRTARVAKVLTVVAKWEQRKWPELRREKRGARLAFCNVYCRNVSNIWVGRIISYYSPLLHQVCIYIQKNIQKNQANDTIIRSRAFQLKWDCHEYHQDIGLREYISHTAKLDRNRQGSKKKKRKERKMTNGQKQRGTCDKHLGEYKISCPVYKQRARNKN